MIFQEKKNDEVYTQRWSKILLQVSKALEKKFTVSKSIYLCASKQ